MGGGRLSEALLCAHTGKMPESLVYLENYNEALRKLPA